MNMKKRLSPALPFLGIALAVLIPGTANAQATQGLSKILPVEMSMTSFLIIGGLLLYSVVLFFVFKSRFNSASLALTDITAELEHTRQRFTETSQTLEKTELNLKNTTQRYQGILFDAQVGMFQMDLDGKCTYINTALQELSGLYPKKALKEGLQSAIHPDDRAAFDKEWSTFTKGSKPLTLSFRFKHAKGTEVHVTCLANRVFNEQKKVESYIGWVSNVTDFHKEHLQEQARTARYIHFIEDTIEGYYHLAPEVPIPLTGSADKMATAIMGGMKLTACNESFADLYGSTTDSLIGKEMSALQNGCGPFKNKDAVKKLVEANYRMIDFESVRQDPRGNRLNLLNNAVGIVEDNKLVGIWGSQRNVSQLKREKEELISQARFMHRILDALPADVHVKDTRCRYLYASRKLAERTGIPQETWIGKTIFEVMPATPRDYDKTAINVMKTGKLSRVERSYEARKKTGWMETVQIPLVSDDGLIEGVVGLSFETSDRKKKEEDARKQRKQLQQQLQTRTKELQTSQEEYGKTATTLHDTNKKLRIREAELENHKNDFNKQLNERKHAEELLRRNEETLLIRQKQLEEQLSCRLTELGAETDKRKKWEELLAIKENELQKLEESANARSKQLTEEIAQREQMQASLETGKAELERYNREIEDLKKEQKKILSTEHTARTAAEGQLKKTTASLQAAQTRIQTLIERHATELEHEVAERKTASSKLIQSAEELDELKHKFNERIELETKVLKKELAQKQIHEKALRQQGKDLETRIQELEKTLQTKIQENNEQVQAREGAEVQRQQIEQKLENMGVHQRQLIERETQKLNLNIAEIRLEEIKLRKEVGDLEQEKESLENLVKTHEGELVKAAREQENLSTTLTDAQEKLKDLKNNQAALVAQETQTLQEEIKGLKQTESDLRQQEELLKKKDADLKETIKKLTSNLNVETRNRETVEKELAELQVAFDTSQDNITSLIQQQTEELCEQIKQHEKNEAELKKSEESLKKQAAKLQKTIDARTNELADAQQEREKAELELSQVIERSSQSAQEIEVRIAEIKQGHLDEIQSIKDEQKELRQKEKYYRTLFQSSADAFLQIDLKSGKIQSANLAAAQLFGRETTKALTGKTMDALSPEHQPGNTLSADMAKARLHSALETGHESFEWEFLKAGKKAFSGLVSLSTIDIEEKQLILAVVNDISGLRKRQMELQQAVDEAHAANKMNSRVVDEVTETVQSSLDPVVHSAAAIATADNLTGEQKLDMEVINRNCRTLIDTMSYRCELSHIVDGSDEVEPAKCDLHELIKDLDQQFSRRAETKKLFFAVSYAQYQSANNVPKFVETDEHKIRKVLGILLGYALAHTEKGRLGLHAARKSDGEDTISVAFELAYTGKANEDELLTQIFSSDDTGAEDMQYGLTLAQKYIRMLGGEIMLEYRKGDVTALTIEFPFTKVASEIVMPGNDAEVKKGAA